MVRYVAKDPKTVILHCDDLVLQASKTPKAASSSEPLRVRSKGHWDYAVGMGNIGVRSIRSGGESMHSQIVRIHLKREFRRLCLYLMNWSLEGLILKMGSLVVGRAMLGPILSIPMIGDLRRLGILKVKIYFKRTPLHIFITTSCTAFLSIRKCQPQSTSRYDITNDI